MRLGDRLYDLIISLEEYILCYCKDFIKLLTSHSQLVSKTFHSYLSSNEDQISHDLQPRGFLH